MAENLKIKDLIKLPCQGESKSFIPLRLYTVRHSGLILLHPKEITVCCLTSQENLLWQSSTYCFWTCYHSHLAAQCSTSCSLHMFLGIPWSCFDSTGQRQCQHRAYILISKFWLRWSTLSGKLAINRARPSLSYYITPSLEPSELASALVGCFWRVPTSGVPGRNLYISNSTHLRVLQRISSYNIDINSLRINGDKLWDTPRSIIDFKYVRTPAHWDLLELLSSNAT